jgi:hypothetical protein
VLATTGKVLITGGDNTINGVRNWSTSQVEIFDPQDDSLRTTSHMVYERWYPSVVSLPNGEVAILGGRQDRNTPDNTPAEVPEIYNPTSGWRTLSAAASLPAYGLPGKNWFYPRAYVTRFGDVFVLGYDGNTFTFDPKGDGKTTQLALTTLKGRFDLPTVMYAPNKLLSLRQNKKVILVNLFPKTPQSQTRAISTTCVTGRTPRFSPMARCW